MFDSANAAFWSSSLMWALLSLLIVMPALVVVNHASGTGETRETPQSAGQEPSPEEEQKPFVEKSTKEMRTLWPEPEQGSEWPPDGAVDEKKHSREEKHVDAS